MSSLTVKAQIPPIKKLWIFESFTISPDEKTLVFQDSNAFEMYIIDLAKQKIIDKIKITSDSLLTNYYWKSDSSYFTFTITQHELYKYLIPKS